MLLFLRENARWVGGGFLLTVLSSFGQTFFIAMSAGELREVFSLSHGEFGGLYMLATLASAATLPFLGRIVDVLTVRNTVLVCLPALAVACIAMSAVPHVLVLLVVLYALRLFGQGMMTHIAMTAMGRWYDAQRGRAVSVAALGHQFGEMVLPLTFVALASIGLGWRGVWLASAVALLLIGLPLAVTLLGVERVPQAQSNDRAVDAHSWTRQQVLRDPPFWIAMTGVLAAPFIGTTVFFHQVYLVELRGWSIETFASGFALMAALTIAAGLFAGWIIDRIGAVRLLPFFALPLAAACFVIGTGTGEAAIFAFFALLGVSYGISQTLFGALWPEMYGTRHLGSIRSAIAAMMVVATAAGPGLTGWLIDLSIDLPRQMIAMGLYCLVIAGVLALVTRIVLERGTPVAVREAAA